jgi:CPA1 family monovalent cation:H+ antiporter
MSADEFGIILLVASVVAILSRKLRVPYSVGLVAAGIGLTWLGAPIDLVLTPKLIFAFLLPPLIFEAAMQISWRPFRKDLPITLTLAFFGVLLAAAIVAAGMHTFVGWSWLGSALFGALIAATDPVSVIAAFKEMKVDSRLSLLVESESLLNDGVCAVTFAILVSIAQGQELHFDAIVTSLGFMIVGSLVVGAAVSGVILLVAGRTDDHLVEITLTTIAAFGSFATAEHLHMSGVLATLACGLIIGNVGWLGSISPTGREHVVSFWEYAAFLANSVVFILIGGHEAHQGTRLFSIWAALAVAMMLFSRIATVYPLCAIFGGSSLKLDIRYQHVLVWGGLRGALALALALATPDVLPEKGPIITVAFAVVAFSIFAQGLTIPLLIKKLDLAK